MKLDELDLDRYWRFALPVAAAGVAVSAVLTVVVVAADEPPDAAGPLMIGLLLTAFAVNLGTILTIRRLGPARPRRPRTAAGWIAQSVVSAAVFLAALQWRSVWAGPDSEWLLAAVPGVINATAIATALRYRRAVRAWRASGPPASEPSSIPPPAPTYLPPGSGAAADSTAPRGPWAYPTTTDAAGSAPVPDGRSGWPRLRWPGADPPQPSDDREDGRSPWRFLPSIVTAVAVVTFIATRSGTDTVVGDPDRPFYVGTVVAMDEPTLPRGVLLPNPPDPVWAAACRNYRDWLDDRSLNTDLVIVDDATLVRSAELLDGAYAHDRLAVEAETLIVHEGNVAGAVRRMRADDWPEADVEHATAYYRARQDPPSAAALDRYVIYTTSQTRFNGIIARLAVDPEHELIRKPAFTRIQDISVQLTDGTTVRIDEELCWS